MAGEIVDRKLSHIIDQLLDYAPRRDRDLFIESRGQQVIASALNLMRLIRESYDAGTADDLSRRLVRAISSGDEDKFRRRVRSLRAAKTKPSRKPVP